MRYVVVTFERGTNWRAVALGDLATWDQAVFAADRWLHALPQTAHDAAVAVVDTEAAAGDVDWTSRGWLPLGIEVRIQAGVDMVRREKGEGGREKGEGGRRTAGWVEGEA